MKSKSYRLWILVVLGLAAALVLDGPAVALMRDVGFERLKAFRDRDWWQLFRQVGSVWAWVLVSGALVLHASGEGGMGRQRTMVRSLTPLIAAILGGALAELFKMFACRMRPEFAVPPDVWAWANLADQFPSTRGIGMPSSHAATAFGGAWGLAMLFPRAGLVGLIAAVGCAATRVIAGAHYPSDVYVGAVVGYASAWLVWTWGVHRPESRAAG